MNMRLLWFVIIAISIIIGIYLGISLGIPLNSLMVVLSPIILSVISNFIYDVFRGETVLSIRYLPRPVTVSISFPKGTPRDTEGFVEIRPSEGYNFFKITEFELVTPPEVEGNIIISSHNNPVDKPEHGDRLLAQNQKPNTTKHYKAIEWDETGAISCDKFWLYGRVLSTITTEDRTVTLYLKGKQVKVFGLIYQLKYLTNKIKSLSFH